MSNYEWLTTCAPSTPGERELAARLMADHDRRGIEDLTFQVIARKATS